MKIKLAVTAALLAAVCAPVFPADPTAAAQADARVEVVYVNPEKFTDVKTSEIGLERDRDHILAQIKDFLVERATKQVPRRAEARDLDFGYRFGG
ncbi:MAG: DUF3016 domain-containing protein [Nibricoccus sp.]